MLVKLLSVVSTSSQSVLLIEAFICACKTVILTAQVTRVLFTALSRECTLEQKNYHCMMRRMCYLVVGTYQTV
jgi:hypothetical protein